MKLFSGVFGVLMIAAAAWPAGPLGLALLAAAAGAVVAGLFRRQACVPAVLVTVVGTALGDPVPLLAAVSGLAATAYLLTRYADDAPTLTMPTAIGMLGFTVAGAAAATIPLRLTGVPLIAPAIMVAMLIAAVLPLVGEATVPTVSEATVPTVGEATVPTVGEAGTRPADEREPPG